jgi:hypothetical protein
LAKRVWFRHYRAQVKADSSAVIVASGVEAEPDSQDLAGGIVGNDGFEANAGRGMILGSTHCDSFVGLSECWPGDVSSITRRFG